MAWQGDDVQYKRWDEFHYFDYSIAVNSTNGIDTFLGFSVPWKLQEIRLHFSTAIVSDTDFVIKLSSGKDSGLNYKLLSQTLLGIQDFIINYGDPLLFFSNGQIIFSTGSISTTNLAGISILGWCVRG